MAISAKRPGKIRIKYSQWFFWAALPLKRNLQTNKQIARKNTMITLDAFLVFLGAASLPVIYIFLLSRWLEPEYRRAYDKTGQNVRTAHKTKRAAKRQQVLQPA